MNLGQETGGGLALGNSFSWRCWGWEAEVAWHASQVWRHRIGLDEGRMKYGSLLTCCCKSRAETEAGGLVFG